MTKETLSLVEINNIRELRQKGYTLSEIKTITKRGYGTVFKYMRSVPILQEYQEIWKTKRGGSKAKSQKAWESAKKDAGKLIVHIGHEEKMFILACLYWGEGNKKELNLINSDPDLVKVFISCLRSIGVKNNELKISLRIFEDIDRIDAIKFWQSTLNLPSNTITKIDQLVGKKKGKLKYGMCRVGVKKGARYFKLIISMINLIKASL